MNRHNQKNLTEIFLEGFPIKKIQADNLSAVLSGSNDSTVSIVFLWGKQCPNCDIAKRMLLSTPERFTWPDVQWYHCNVYDDFEMANRFSLHGIPVFIVYAHSKNMATKPLGRITGWPGSEAFVKAVEQARIKAKS